MGLMGLKIKDLLMLFFVSPPFLQEFYSPWYLRSATAHNTTIIPVWPVGESFETFEVYLDARHDLAGVVADIHVARP